MTAHVSPQPSSTGGKIHPAPDFTVTNAAALAALTLSSTDVFKFAWQQDIGRLLILTSVGPAVWMTLAPTTTATSSADGLMAQADKTKIDRDSLVTISADVTNSTTTAADITGLSFALASGKTYEFEFNIIHQSAASGTGCQTALNGPANSQFASRSWQPGSATNLTVQRAANAVEGYSTAVAVPTANADWLCTISGMITTAASGTLIGRFKSSTAATTVTARAGSWAKLKLIS